MDIKTLCTVMVTNHKEVVAMKEKMDLSIAMQEMADSKISKTFDHDIANRMIDSMRACLRNATFGNIAEKTQLAEILQTYKTSGDGNKDVFFSSLSHPFLDFFSNLNPRRFGRVAVL